MLGTLFSDTTSSVLLLVEQIRQGDLALPDIQRPFVWQATKVRDLLDSMYRGYPVGYLLFWDTGADANARTIGVNEKPSHVPKKLIVDGQQRLTSLFAVMTGTPVIRDDYSRGTIRIAFRPSDETFAVTDAAIEKDPEYVPDISALWNPATSSKKTFKEYRARLAQKREVPDDEADRLEEALDGVARLNLYQFKIVELSAAVDEERVAEIFVRINSEGVTLNQADFILTLMSVWWEEGRRQLEAFARAAKTPSLAPGPFNYYIAPSPAQLLRVTVALAFRRAVLRHAYTLLRGRDLESGQIDPTTRDQQFAKLAAAQHKVLDITNWHEFLQSLERAGFRSSKMISSENVVLFAYALWLIGRVDFAVPLDRLREVMARWFFMAHTTGRYSGSFETQFEADVARLAPVAPGDADAFITTLNGIVDATLTNDFWAITLPNDLATSASKSPALMAYMAALNILDADTLLSTGKVRSRLDPAIVAKKGIERHHLFPRAYLKKLGIGETRRINQIANMALVEWFDNISISDQAPTAYWPKEVGHKKIPEATLARQREQHALPAAWPAMGYEEFLDQRRQLMSQVARKAFGMLGEQAYQPAYPAPVDPLTVAPTAGTGKWRGGGSLVQMVELGLVPAHTTLISVTNPGVVATVTPDGRVQVEDELYDTPSAAARAVSETAINGWTFWAADLPDGVRPLEELRAECATLSIPVAD